MRTSKKGPTQLDLDLNTRSWGGARKGAGRKKTGTSKDAPHRARPDVKKHHVQHVVLRTRKDVPRLRRGATYAAIARALRQTLGEHAFRVVHTSIQHNHLHFLIEADDKDALSHGMRSLSITAARAINKVCERSGQVFAYRYHATAIRSPRQMRNALAYVLNNWRRHSEDEKNPAARMATLDPYSTAIRFGGWKQAPKFAVPERYEPLPAAEATTWLLRIGWQRHGLISAYDVPGSM